MQWVLLRAALLNLIPQWSQLTELCYCHANLNKITVPLSLIVYTGDLRKSFGSHVDYPLFWRLGRTVGEGTYASPQYPNSGLTTKWDPILGFSIHAAEQHTGDSQADPRVWGEHSLIPAHKFRYAEMMDNSL